MSTLSPQAYAVTLLSVLGRTSRYRKIGMPLQALGAIEFARSYGLEHAVPLMQDAGFKFIQILAVCKVARKLIDQSLKG